ncbi:hypothetical protein D9M68_285420 [compost metagenome]
MTNEGIARERVVGVITEAHSGRCAPGHCTGTGRGMGIGIGSAGIGAGIGGGSVAAGMFTTRVETDSRITPPPITLPSTLLRMLPALPSTRASQSARSAGGCRPQRATALAR